MSSGPFINGIINRTGSIPGESQGTFAAMPVTGAAVGDLYFTTDTNTLYSWNGAAWIAILTGGAAGTITGAITAFKMPFANAANTLADTVFQYLSVSGTLQTASAVQGHLLIKGANVLGMQVVTTPAGNYTATGVEGTILVSGPGAVGVTLPASVPNNFIGWPIRVKRLVTAGLVTIGAAAGAQIDGGPNTTLAVANQAKTFVWDGANYFIV